MRLAILGGSFNPVHIGHLRLAETVLSAGYDRVILIPAFVSPFKAEAQDSRPQDRLDMVAAAICAEQHLSLDDCEIRRQGISYTIDTVEDIIRRYLPEGKPGLVLGDDLAASFSQWRNAGEIAEKVDLVIARRVAKKKPVFPFPAIRLDNAVMEISSREIRRSIAGGEPWRYLVPEGARLIIEDRRLYGYVPRPAGGGAESLVSENGVAESTSAKGELVAGNLAEGKTIPPGTIRGLIARVEGTARSMLGSSRFIHSRNTALAASDLARRFGLDPDRAYLAGIAHDLAKDLPAAEQKRLAKRDGGEISRLEEKKPSLLHGRAAATLVREWFDLEDGAVLEAIRVHTSGAPGMGDLAKIVYIADKTEPGRPRVSPELRIHERYTGLDHYFGNVLEETVAWLESKKYEIASGTGRLLEAIHGNAP